MHTTKTLTMVLFPLALAPLVDLDFNKVIVPWLSAQDILAINPWIWRFCPGCGQVQVLNILKGFEVPRIEFPIII